MDRQGNGQIDQHVQTTASPPAEPPRCKQTDIEKRESTESRGKERIARKTKKREKRKERGKREKRERENEGEKMFNQG